MDKTLYNASGCKDKTAHDAICAANKRRCSDRIGRQEMRTRICL